MFPITVYDEKTATLRPVVDGAVRAALVMGIEWSSLTLIEDAPRYVKFATFFLSISALAVWQNRPWLYRRWKWWFPILMLPLVLAFIGVWTYAYIEFTPVTSVVAKQPPAQAPTKSAEPATPKKFYSDDDKNRLAEAMYAVSTDLTDKADKAVNKAIELAGLFANENSQNAGRYDPAALASKLKEARDLLLDHEETMAAINAKYTAYHDELIPIWDWNVETQSRIRFREALGDVETHITAFQDAHAIGALAVDYAIIQSMPQCITIMQERAHDFSLWSSAARLRADNFRHSL